MITLRRAFIVMSFALLMSIILAACGTDTNTGSGNSNMGMGATTPTATMGMGMDATPTATMGMGMGATPTATMMGSSKKSTFIHTATVKINGQSVKVLTNSKGHMLY